MNLQQTLQQAIEQTVDRIAAKNDVEALGIAVAVSLAVGDVETVNYIGDRYGSMFNAEQQQAFADIKAQTPAILAAQAAEREQAEKAYAQVEINDNPLTEHLASLNRTMQ